MIHSDDPLASQQQGLAVGEKEVWCCGNLAILRINDGAL